MFTLKMKFFRYKGEAPGKPTALDEEYTEFVLADRIVVHDVIPGAEWEDRMKAWEPGTYYNILSVTYFESGETGSVVYADGRLITVERNGQSSWSLVSHAWLLGPDGKTIERVA